MKEQLSPFGIMLLLSALIIFWVAVLVLVRMHARRRDPPPHRMAGPP